VPSTSKERKRALRAELIAARARLTLPERQAASLAIAEQLRRLDLFTRAHTVALYATLGTEVDSAPVAALARDLGAVVAWPRAVVGERRLEFAACPPAELIRGPLGAAEPPPDARPVPLEDLDAIVMPAVALSEDGLRLGRGGGYYDVTLKLAPRAARIGVAFDAQVRPELPRDPHDVPLDAVVTDRRLLRFERAPTQEPA
jgi:5-formyltetrahydrofolate cyclo-ligase